jgi:hypothetical protein
MDLNKLHADAMTEVASANAAGVKIGNKHYTTVARRVEIFRKHFGPFGRLRVADHHENEAGSIYMRAVVELKTDLGWEEVAEGRAEEVRGSNPITRTSAIEVCETSAYGRALANFGLHGGEFASANEVENAVAKQNGKARKDGSKPGIGHHSPFPDEDPKVSTLAALYASNLTVACKKEDVDAIRKLIADMATECDDEGELWRDVLKNAAWHRLPSDERSYIKKVLLAAEEPTAS